MQRRNREPPHERHRSVEAPNARDDGATYPESNRTLELQREQLIAGRRAAMLYPSLAGRTHVPFPVPAGMKCLSTAAGEFHFNPGLTSESDILRAWETGRLNEIFGYGPYSKDDIAKRVLAGEHPIAIVECDGHGVEVKAVAGTIQTADEQLAALESTKTPGHLVFVTSPMDVMRARVSAAGGNRHAIDVLRHIASISPYRALMNPITSAQAGPQTGAM